MTNVFIADVLPRMTRFLALVLVACATVALATSYIAPERKLTLQERVASTVGDSPFIAVGRVVAGYDTVVSNGGTPESFAVVLFEPLEVLRGSESGRVRVVFWKSSSAASGGRPGERYVWSPSSLPAGSMLACFEDISRYRRSRPSFLGDAAAGVSDWAAGDSESPYSIPRLVAWGDSAERLVGKEIREQEPEALTQDAEVVVLAQPDGKRWKVARTLKGRKEPTIEVRTLVPAGLDRGEQALLFLHRVDGKWEPIRFRAGLVTVRRSRVPRWSCSLEEAIARITR